MAGWITLLSMNEMGKLGGITQEKDRCVVCNHVPITLLSAELDGESSRVTSTYEERGISVRLVIHDIENTEDMNSTVQW